MSISDRIHNYYELKVVEVVNVLARPRGYTEDQLVDLACIALNHLPTRYFSHEVDIAFYMSAHEYEEINRRVNFAVTDAISFIESHRASS